MQYCTFVLLVIPLMESCFYFADNSGQTGIKCIRYEKYRIKHSPETELRGPKASKIPSHWDGWTLICQ